MHTAPRATPEQGGLHTQQRGYSFTCEPVLDTALREKTRDMGVIPTSHLFQHSPRLVRTIRPTHTHPRVLHRVHLPLAQLPRGEGRPLVQVHCGSRPRGRKKHQLQKHSFSFTISKLLKGAVLAALMTAAPSAEAAHTIASFTDSISPQVAPSEVSYNQDILPPVGGTLFPPDLHRNTATGKSTNPYTCSTSPLFAFPSADGNYPKEPTHVVDPVSGLLLGELMNDYDDELKKEIAKVLVKAQGICCNSLADIKGLQQPTGEHLAAIGVFEDLAFDIVFVDGDENKPVWQKGRRFSPLEQEVLDEYLNELKQFNLIEKAPPGAIHAQPFVIAAKKSPSTGAWTSKRVCLNTVRLNDRTVLDRTRPDTIDSIFHRMKDSTVFSVIDLKSAFHQVPLTERAKAKLCFYWNGVLWRHTTMPFGPRNAPSQFVRLMNHALSDLSDFCTVYLDDVAIFSKDAITHIKHLEALCARLANVGLAIHPIKSIFFTKYVEYLGMCLEPGQVSPSLSKCTAIAALEAPTDLTTLRAVLGLGLYYAHFDPSFATVTRPMNDLLAGGGPRDFQAAWGEKQQAAFEQMKRNLLRPGLAIRQAKDDRPFLLHTDWSTQGIGCILAQQDDQGREYIVAAASRSLNKHERAYSSFEGELLACIYGCRTFRHFLHGVRFLFVTDHKPLLWIRNHSESGSKYTRWLATVSDMSFDIIHRSGKDHVNVDILSRAPLHSSKDLSGARADHDIVTLRISLKSSSSSKSATKSVTFGAVTWFEYDQDEPTAINPSLGLTHRRSPIFARPRQESITHVKVAANDTSLRLQHRQRTQAYALYTAAKTACLGDTPSARPTQCVLHLPTDSEELGGAESLAGTGDMELEDRYFHRLRTLHDAARWVQDSPLSSATVFSVHPDPVICGINPETSEPRCNPITSENSSQYPLVSTLPVGNTWIKNAEDHGVAIIDLFGGLASSIEAVLKANYNVIRYVYVDNDREVQTIAKHRLGELSVRFSNQLNHAAIEEAFSAFPMDVELITDQHITAFLSSLPGSPAIFISAGFPCQAMSNAGNQAGLSDPRSGLFFSAIAIVSSVQVLCRTRLKGVLPVGYVLENTAAQHNRNESAATTSHKVITSILGDPLCVDAARVGSYAHRLRNFYCNLAPIEALSVIYEGIKRDPSRLVEDILADCHTVQLSPFTDMPPYYPCNQKGKRPRALPTLMARAYSYSFRPEKAGSLYNKSHDLWEEPFAEERELCLGYLRGSTAAPGVTEHARRKALGNCIDLRMYTSLLQICRVLPVFFTSTSRKTAQGVAVQTPGHSGPLASKTPMTVSFTAVTAATKCKANHLQKPIELQAIKSKYGLGYDITKRWGLKHNQPMGIVAAGILTPLDTTALQKAGCTCRPQYTKGHIGDIKSAPPSMDQEVPWGSAYKAWRTFFDINQFMIAAVHKPSKPKPLADSCKLAIEDRLKETKQRELYEKFIQSQELFIKHLPPTILEEIPAAVRNTIQQPDKYIEDEALSIALGHLQGRLHAIPRANASRQADLITSCDNGAPESSQSSAAPIIATSEPPEPDWVSEEALHYLADNQENLQYQTLQNMEASLQLAPVAKGNQYNLQVFSTLFPGSDKSRPSPIAVTSKWDRGGSMLDPYNDDNLMRHLKGEAISSVSADLAEQRRISNRAPAFRWDHPSSTLYREFMDGSPRIIPMPKERDALVRQYHCVAVHLGQRRTYQLLGLRYYWKGMKAQVAKVLNACEECRQRHAVFSAQPDRLQSLQIKSLGYRWSLDTCKFPESLAGFCRVLVCIEHLARFLLLIPMRNKSSDEVTLAFRLHILAVFGAPAEVLTDQGTEFQGEFTALLTVLSVDHRTTSAYHAQSNGLAERMVQVTKRAISIKVAEKAETRLRWEHELAMLQLAYNCSIQSSTKYAPSTVMLGHTPTVPPAVRERFAQELNLSVDNSPEQDESISLLISQRATLIRQVGMQVISNLQVSQHRDTLRFAHVHSGHFKASTVPLYVGDFVYVRRQKQDGLECPVKPQILRIVHVSLQNVATLEGPAGTVATAKRHISQLTKCFLNNIDTRYNGERSPDEIPLNGFEETACEICDKPDDAEQMILCDTCNKGFHLWCCAPPFTTVPRGDWFCPACQTLAGKLPSRKDKGKAKIPSPAAPNRGAKCGQCPPCRNPHWKQRCATPLGAGTTPIPLVAPAPIAPVIPAEEDMGRTLSRDNRALRRSGSYPQTHATIANDLAGPSNRQIWPPPTWVSIPWSFTSAAAVGNVLRKIMPGEYFQSHLSRLYSTLTKLNADALAIRNGVSVIDKYPPKSTGVETPLETIRRSQLQLGLTTVCTVPAEVSRLYSTVRLEDIGGALLDPWAGTCTIEATLQIHGIQVISSDLNPKSPAAHHYDALSLQSYDELMRTHGPISGIITSPHFAVLDIAFPLAVAASRSMAAIHCPGHYYYDATKQRWSMFERLQDEGRLEVIAGLPLGPLGRRNIWIVVFADHDTKLALLRNSANT